MFIKQNAESQGFYLSSNNLQFLMLLLNYMYETISYIV